MTGLARAYLHYLIFAPIAFLMFVGAIIALRSGIRELSSIGDYVKLAGNFSRMVLRIAGYVTILMAVQYLIGLRPTLGW